MNENPYKATMSFEAFQHIIAEQLQIEESKIVSEASFVNDLKVDSIQLVDLMLRLEEMGISIPIDAAWDVQTVGDAYRLYQEQAARGTDWASGERQPASGLSE